MEKRERISYGCDKEAEAGFCDSVAPVMRRVVEDLLSGEALYTEERKWNWQGGRLQNDI